MVLDNAIKLISHCNWDSRHTDSNKKKI